MTVQERLEYAERRLQEEAKNGDSCDINYWRGYYDAVKRIVDEQKADRINSCPKCGSYGLRFMKICNGTVQLVECAVCGWNTMLPKEMEE